MIDNLFSENYFEAKEKFLVYAKNNKAKSEKINISSEKIQNNLINEIDTAILGNLSAKNVFIVTSGLHGIEGFCGSALQLFLMDYLKSFNLSNVSVIFIHCINPYGMINLRRVNENNIDLNRNFTFESSLIPEPPKHYWKVDKLLNQSVPSNHIDLFLIKLFKLAFQIGVGGIVDSLACGQFYNSKGLFFGGLKMEESSKNLIQYLLKKLQNSSKIIIMDLHSGIGKYCNPSLLAHTNNKDVLQKLENIFKSKIKIGHSGKNSYYPVNGNFLNYLLNVLNNEKYCEIYPITYEFGTLNTLNILNALRSENMLHYYNKYNIKIEQKIKNNFKECFCPSSKTWRNNYIKNGSNYFINALKYLRV